MAPQPFFHSSDPLVSGPGPDRAYGPADLGMGPVNPQQQPNAGYLGLDTGLSWKLASMIIVALVTVFVLQKLGFRFVTSVSGSVGVGGS